MDSIIIMDKECTLFVTILTKSKGYTWGEMQEEIKPWMLDGIEKQNFSNKECKVLRMHVEFVLLTLINK
jgi:hypothetical protein